MNKTFVCFFVILLTTILFCQEQVIDFYGNKIKIGMTEEELNKSIGFPYELIKMNDNGSFVLKDNITGKFVLSIGFENKQISFVSRNWVRTEDETTVGFTKKIYLLLKKIQDEGLERAKIETTSNIEAEYNVYSIWVSYGDKKINLNIFEGENKHESTLYEELDRTHTR